MIPALGVAPGQLFEDRLAAASPCKGCGERPKGRSNPQRGTSGTKTLFHACDNGTFRYEFLRTAVDSVQVIALWEAEVAKQTLALGAHSVPVLIRSAKQIHARPADLKAHPMAEAFPLIEGDEFKTLVADIKANGVREPIVVWQGQILDGRNRHRAAQAAERDDFPVVEFEGNEGDALKFVISCNLMRRHLSAGMRAALASDFEAGQWGGNHQERNSVLPAPTRAEVAATFKTSVDSVRVAAKVKKADPALHEEVKAGRVTLHAAEQKVDAPKQRRAEKAIAVTTGLRPVAEILADLEPLRKEIKRQVAAAKTAQLPDAEMWGHAPIEMANLEWRLRGLLAAQRSGS